MTAVVSLMLGSLRRRLAVAVVVALAAVALPASPAAAAKTSCAPGDEVCVKSGKAPSPAPANQTAPSTAGKHGNTSIPSPTQTPKTTFWDDLSNFALTWGPLIF